MTARRKILVVDDEEINRKILARILRDDYEILTAENGKKALQILETEKEQISAILLDLVMPKMDGYEMLAAMHENAMLSTIPVVVATQKDGDEAETRALALGAADFIIKPYKPEMIKHRLENMISLREATDFPNIPEKDMLTGIFNKNSFYRRAAELLRNNPQTAYQIISIDVKHFKLINDAYGEEEGDRLLQYLAAIIADIAEKYRGIAARMKADQFMTILPKSDRQDRKFLEEITGMMKEYPIGMKVMLKFGIYQVEDRSIHVTAMCERALLAAKEIREEYGENYSYYDESIRKRYLFEQEITNELGGALKKHELIVYYQPQFDLFRETIVGAEAMVRWNHPDKGFLLPHEFVPLFEKNGLITQLDFYVWEEVCRQIREWHDRCGKYIAVSVNIARADLYHPNLASLLSESVKKYDLTPDLLHLELSEAAYTKNPAQLAEATKKLKEAGFIIEMGNFGSGYSSLNMLIDLPIDILKLDIECTKKENLHGKGCNLLNFIISLAKWMGLPVVADGVETPKQVALLQNMDCNYAQGYYYAKPMLPGDLEQLIAGREISRMNYKKQYQPIERFVAPPSQKNKRQMLIVDDTEINRAILKDTFSNEYNIVEVDNGAAAYEYLKEHGENVAVIMLDLIMPVMDGFQFLMKIKKDQKLCEIPIIVTSQAGEASEARVLEMGADDFIAKPYHPEVAIRRVENVLAAVRLRALKQQEKKQTGNND